MLEHFETKDIIFRIKEKLKSPAREIFQDLQDGYDIIEIAVNRSIPLQTVYTIIRRKIKPIAKRLMNIE